MREATGSTCFKSFGRISNQIWRSLDFFGGVPATRIIVYWGLFWGSLIQENYHFQFEKRHLKTRLLSCCTASMKRPWKSGDGKLPESFGA